MNEDQKQEMIDSVMGLLMNVVSDWAKRLPHSVSFDELKQAALVRLNRAAEMFQPDKGVPWAMYAKHHIRGGCLDMLRESDGATRHARRHSHAIDKAQHALNQRFMRTATSAEVAEELGITSEQLAARQTSLGPVTSIEALKADPDHSWEPEAQRGPDEVAWQEIKRLLDDAQLNCLSPRYRKVLELYYLQELRMYEIAEVMGVNHTRICQIIKEAQRKLRVEFASRGYSRVDQLLPRAA